MIKCKLYSYETDHKLHKEDDYMRAYLRFKIVIFGLFTYYKNVIYDVTMFENYKQHTDYWDSMIIHNELVNYKIIKNRIIF